MKYAFLILLALSTGALVFFVERAKHGNGEGAEQRAGWFRHPEEHMVTPEMLTKAEKLVDQRASDFQCLGSDGKTYSLQDLVTDRPLVLLFIKEDCPCSVEAQPFFNRMAALYGGQATFMGVIDGGEAVAREWARQRKPSFPLLCDPDLKIVRRYQASNSVYVALIAKGGKVEQYWPGFSGTMLQTLGTRIAGLTGTSDQPIDINDAPDEMVSGCPYPDEPAQVSFVPRRQPSF